MRADDLSLTVVREWVVKAEADLLTASHTLKLAKQCPTDTVCFHAQQCVEKYLKAVLVLHHTPVPRTHDIESLVRVLPPEMLADWPLIEQRRLTTYATVTRYPGSYEPIGLAEARDAVRLAKRIAGLARAAMPSACLLSPRQP